MNKQIKRWNEIPYSEKATTYIKSLKPNVAVAVRMRHVNSSDDNLPKVQIEIAEKLTVPGRTTSALGRLNADDDRFSSGAQRSWETVSPDMVKQLFGWEIPDGEASVEILQPMPSIDGVDFHIQYTEDVESSLNDSEAQYPENYLKRAGAEGNFFYTEDGQRVISRKRLVEVPKGTLPQHTYLKGSFRTEANASNEPVLTRSQAQAASESEVQGTLR